MLGEPSKEDWEAYYELCEQWARATTAAMASVEFSVRYYNKDHLGNIREVVSKSDSIEQVTNYYPFGTPIHDLSNNPEFQPFKYNGKELDMMHGLNTLDYGARQYDPVLPVWDRVEHEFDHAVDDLNNHKIHEDRKELLDNQYDNKEERSVIKGSETKTAKKIHQGVRTNHKGTIYLVKDPRFTK